MDEFIRAIESDSLREQTSFRAGDIVKVYERITEGAKKRTQIFEGLVLKTSSSGTKAMVTVRKRSSGIGVEKTFPLHAPWIEKIDVVKKGRVRQSRPYYLRRLA
ncbi:50S ribosomal protein L19 [Candidatus Acetothermia bacterium]|nr:50S ribosomal protein L19 [Candidatus Acetothermia bacterium]